jgi:hypothetical protein
MLVSFVLLILTSIILYIEPQGRVAYWSDWRLWGLSKTQWGDLHLNLGALFLLAGIFHLVYNWKAITAYLKDKARQLRIFTANFNLAVAVTLFVAAGTLLDIPPMSTLWYPSGTTSPTGPTGNTVSRPMAMQNFLL